MNNIQKDDNMEAAVGRENTQLSTTNLNSLPRNLGGLCIGGLNKLAASVINGCLSALGHSEPEEGGSLLACNSDEPAAAAES
jgi:hypothetical protein